MIYINIWFFIGLLFHFIGYSYLRSKSPETLTKQESEFLNNKIILISTLIMCLLLGGLLILLVFFKRKKASI